MSILGEFKTFIAKGDVMDLAVGVIIGAAFKSVVDSMVKDIITPFIALVCKVVFHTQGPPNFGDISFHGIMIGSFINAIISFLIMAAVVFFFIVKPMNHLMAKINKPAPPPVVETPEDILLLRDIRDTLKTAAR
jgi:large conductance mechanosensitive channel